MSNPRYPELLKIEAAKQVTERGLPVAAPIVSATHRVFQQYLPAPYPYVG